MTQTQRTWPSIGEMKEAELRKRVLVPLLNHTPGVKQVTDVHGVNERGLDVVFVDESQIRETCIGIQIKAGPIRGGGSSDETVNTIINQLDLASNFKQPIALQPSGRKSVEQFIVVTNDQISNTAKAEIVDRIESVPVDFWDANELMRRIRLHYPELATGADSETIQYMLTLRDELNGLDALDQVTGIAQRELADVFVEPRLQKKFDPGIASEGEVFRSSDVIPALTVLSEAERSVVIGEQNSGKTSVLRMLAIEQIENLLEPEQSPPSEVSVPVIIRAIQIVRHGSLLEALREVLEEYGAEKRAADMRTDLNNGVYAILVDGFSELLKEEDKKTCASVVTAFAEKFENNKMVVAARPSDFLSARYFEGFVHFAIQNFDDQQVRSLVAKWTEEGIELPDVAEKVVNRVREALQLPGSPIPAVIGVMLYEKERRYITNTWEAVDRYMVIRLGRYAQEMGIIQEVDWTTKQDLLGEIAFEMVESESEKIDYDDLINRVDETFRRRGETLKGNEAIQELLDAGVLQERNDRVSFHRTAFRDFFAAHDIVHRQGGLEVFAVDHLFERKWSQVLTFAAGSQRHNSNLLRTLSSRVEEKRRGDVDESVDEYVYGAYLLGRILSNSKASDKEPRLRALEVTVEGAEAAIPEFEKVTVQQFGNIGKLAALLGIEQTFFVTVGVPWLENQLRELMDDRDMSDVERFLLLSVYANLGCASWLDNIDRVGRELTSPKALVALKIMFDRLSAKRGIKRSEREQYSNIKHTLERRLERRSEAVTELLKVKDRVLELEQKRMKRLKGGG